MRLAQFTGESSPKPELRSDIARFDKSVLQVKVFLILQYYFNIQSKLAGLSDVKLSPMEIFQSSSMECLFLPARLPDIEPIFQVLDEMSGSMTVFRQQVVTFVEAKLSTPGPGLTVQLTELQNFLSTLVPDVNKFLESCRAFNQVDPQRRFLGFF